MGDRDLHLTLVRAKDSAILKAREHQKPHSVLDTLLDGSVFEVLCGGPADFPRWKREHIVFTREPWQ